MRKSRQCFRLVRFIAGVVLASGIGIVSASAAEKVVLRTDYKFNGYVAPFALALEKKFYEDVGINVSIELGQGSGTTVQTVASGADAFGLADSATAVLGMSAQQIPIKIVSVYTQTGTMGLIYHPNSGFSGNLSEVKGKVVISSAGSADLRLLAPALASANLSVNNVQLQLVDTNARVPLFLQTPGSFLTGFATGDLLRVRNRLPDAKYVPYAQYGVVSYGTGLIVGNDTIQRKPDLVRAFVKASRRGWEEAAKDPEAAVAASIKLLPDLTASADLIREGLKIALNQQLHTRATEGHPIGWTDQNDWSKMLDVLKAYAGIEPKEPSTYYTNEFVGE